MRDTDTKPGDDRYSNKTIIDEETHSIVKSLFFSSIIFYDKCFTKAEGRGIKLNRRIVSLEYRNTHDKIMDYRNTLAAHSGEGKWDTGTVKLILHPKPRDDFGPLIRAELNRLEFVDDRSEEQNFLLLIQHIMLMVR